MSAIQLQHGMGQNQHKKQKHLWEEAMSQIKLNPMFLSASKSLGGIVFYKRNWKIFTRVKGTKTAKATKCVFR